LFFVNYYFGLFIGSFWEFVAFLNSSNKSDWNLAWLSAILDNISVCARCSCSLSRAISTSSYLFYQNFIVSNWIL